MNIIIETLGIITTVLAIAGVVLNNRMDRKCFWFWIVSNAISCGLHVYIGLWSLAVRDAAFLVLAFDGLRRWRKELTLKDFQQTADILGSNIPLMPKVKEPTNEQLYEIQKYFERMSNYTKFKSISSDGIPGQNSTEVNCSLNYELWTID